MNFERIRRAVAKTPALELELDEALDAFRRESGSLDPELFLAYLKKTNRVDERTFRALHADEPIDPASDAGPDPYEVDRQARGSTGERGAEADGLDDTVRNESASSEGSGSSASRSGSDPSSGGTDREREESEAPKSRYVLLGAVGKGGMATVHVAKDRDLLRKVALKQLSAETARHKSLRGRFVKEVRITAQLDHPNIVPVYGLELLPGGAPSYAMKLVDGKTFQDLIQETRAFHEEKRALDEAHSLAARMEHFLKVCDAIGYAHEKGVIHRDLKPVNLMLGRHNEVYVMDWGVCSLVGGVDTGSVELSQQDDAATAKMAADPTKIGAITGTPRYMSPEQASGRNRELDGRSDQYSLGLILHELLALRSAVPGKKVPEIVKNAAEGIVSPLTPDLPGFSIPEGLAAVVAKATARSPSDRYESVAAMADDIRRFLRGEAVLAREETALEKIQRFVVHHIRRSLTAMLAIVAVSALLVLGVLYREKMALVKESRREASLETLRNATSGHADRIQTHFGSLQSGLAGFAAAASGALLHAVPARDKLYWLADFKSPLPSTLGLTESPHYEGKVSFGEPLWIAAPGSDATVLLASARRLQTITSYRRQMFLESHAHEERAAPASGAAEKRIEEEMPLIFTLLGLESGLGSFYPGSNAVPGDYDPRTRPWYALASSQAPGAHWGNPYMDSMGGGLVLPCSTALYGDDGTFLGVAAVLVTFDYVINELLQLPELPEVIEAFLLDEKGRIVVRSRQRASSVSSSGAGLRLEPFPDSNVRDVLQKDNGIVESESQGMSVLIAHDRIDPIGWNLAVMVDAEKLLARGPSAVRSRRPSREQRRPEARESR